jgi:inorganic pyrophosphatase
MIQVLIQAEAGSHDRKIYNEETLEYRETRRMPQPFPYPYGFVIGTSAEDGGAVDCYLITKDRLKAGTIVECEPIGLLEQHEGDEIDHKILASLPGQDVELGNELLKELQDFIYAIFAHFQEAHVRVGHILPPEAALQHIRACQNKPNT